PPSPLSPPFPYTTLFRSFAAAHEHLRQGGAGSQHGGGGAVELPAPLRQFARHRFRIDRTLGAARRDGRLCLLALPRAGQGRPALDRKSTRLNSSHLGISY